MPTRDLILAILLAASGACNPQVVVGSGQDIHAGNGEEGSDAAPVGVQLFVAQNGTGSDTGLDCKNAHSVAWFNDVSNWTASGVGPGVTVRLCGAITSDLVIQADGQPGLPVTIDGTDAILSATIREVDRSWWSVQNCTWVDGHAALLMEMQGGAEGNFSGNYADEMVSTALFLRQSGQLIHRIVIANNFMRTSAANLATDETDIVTGEGAYDIVLEGNHLEMRVAGESSGNILQTWEKGGESAGNPRDWTIRYNRFVMNTSAMNTRSWCMLESLGGTNNIHGNLFLGINGADGANGCAIYGGQDSAVYNFVGNTVVSKGSASNNQLNLQGNGTINLRNNLFYVEGNQGWTLTTSTIYRVNNLWYGLRSPSCTGAGEICGKDPLFKDYANNDFSLQADSPAISAGGNPGAPYDWGITPGSSWPHPTLFQRSASGSWNIGAY